MYIKKRFDTLEEARSANKKLRAEGIKTLGASAELSGGKFSVSMKIDGDLLPHVIRDWECTYVPSSGSMHVNDWVAMGSPKYVVCPICRESVTIVARLSSGGRLVRWSAK